MSRLHEGKKLVAGLVPALFLLGALFLVGPGRGLFERSLVPAGGGAPRSTRYAERPKPREGPAPPTISSHSRVEADSEVSKTSAEKSDCASAVEGVVRDGWRNPVGRYLLIVTHGQLRTGRSLADYLSNNPPNQMVIPVSNPEGRFRISSLGPGLWSFMAWSKRFGLSKAETVTIPSERQKPLELVLPGKGRIVGRVVDAQGRGVCAELFVQAVPELGGFDNADWPEKGVMTSSDGTFSIAASSGTVYMYAKASDGSLSDVLASKLGDGEVQEGVQLKLYPGTELTVTVVENTSRLLSGMPVVVDDVDSRFTQRATTGANGRALMSGVPRGTAYVRVLDQWSQVGKGDLYQSGSRSLASERIEVEGGAAEEITVVIDARSAITVIGSLVSSVESPEGALVRLGRGRAGLGPPVAADESGVFKTSVSSPGDYSVYVSFPSGFYFRQPVVIPDAPTARIDLVAERGTVAGVLYCPNGYASLGGEVTATALPSGMSYSAAVDVAGKYVLDLPEGIYSLSAFASVGDGWLVCSEEYVVCLDSSSGVEQVDFELVQGGELSGVVRRASDAATVRGAVVLVYEGGRVSRLSFTDGTGSFRFLAVRPGPKEVGIWHDELGLAEFVEVVVEPGVVAGADIELVEGRSVGVQITPSSRSDDVSVHVEHAAGGRRRPLRVHDGVHDFGVLPFGGYELRASCESWLETRPLAVTRDGGDPLLVEFALPRR